MSGIGHPHTAFELRGVGLPVFAARQRQKLRLRATEDGWSLLSPEGDVILRTLGTRGRHQCLEYARELGALAVLG